MERMEAPKPAVVTFRTFVVVEEWLKTQPISITDYVNRLILVDIANQHCLQVNSQRKQKAG